MTREAQTLLSYYRWMRSHSHCFLCGSIGWGGIEFHHVNPLTKIDEIGEFVSRGDVLGFIQELRKCIPLCRDCHVKIHAALRDPYHAGEIFTEKVPWSLLDGTWTSISFIPTWYPSVIPVGNVLMKEISPWSFISNEEDWPSTDMGVFREIRDQEFNDGSFEVIDFDADGNPFSRGVFQKTQLEFDFQDKTPQDSSEVPEVPEDPDPTDHGTGGVGGS